MKYQILIFSTCLTGLCAAGCSDSGLVNVNASSNSVCNNVDGNIRNDYFHPITDKKISEEIIASEYCPQEFPYCVDVGNEVYCAKCEKGQIYAMENA